MENLSFTPKALPISSINFEVPLFNTSLDKVARVFAYIGLASLSFSIFFSNFLIVAAILCFFGKNLREKLNFIWSFKINQLGIVLVLFLGIGIFHSVAGEAVGWHEFIKYSYKIMGLMLLMPLFIEEKHRQRALTALLVFPVFFVIVFSILHGFNELSVLNGYNFSEWYHWQETLFKSIAPPIEFSILVSFVGFLLINRCLEKKTPYWIFNLFLFVLTTYFLFFVNVERTGMLVFFSLMILLGWQRLEGKYFFLFIGLAIAALEIVYLSSSIFEERIIAILNDFHQYQQGNIQTSMGVRTTFLKYSLLGIKQHPYIGFGLGSFPWVYQHLGGPLLVDPSTLGDPHNSYLNLTLQAGIGGVLIFVAWILLQFRESKWLPLSEKYIVQGLILSYALSSFFIDAFIRRYSALVYLSLLYVLFAGAGKVKNPHKLV